MNVRIQTTSVSQIFFVKNILIYPSVLSTRFSMNLFINRTQNPNFGVPIPEEITHTIPATLCNASIWSILLESDDGKID